MRSLSHVEGPVGTREMAWDFSPAEDDNTQNEDEQEASAPWSPGSLSRTGSFLIPPPGLSGTRRINVI